MASPTGFEPVTYGLEVQIFKIYFFLNLIYFCFIFIKNHLIKYLKWLHIIANLSQIMHYITT